MAEDGLEKIADGRGEMEKLPGIHALRVIAAVTVYLLHVIVLTAPFVEPVLQVALRLDFGVPLFFTVSAFSLMHSTRPYRGTAGWVRKFYVKRYFRIAPLFYVMSVIYVLIYCTVTFGPLFPVEPWPEWDAILLNLTFLFGLTPKHIASLSLIGWSVGAEMLFYVMFPLLLVSLRGIWSALAFVGASHVIGEIARPMLDPLASLRFTATVSTMHILTNLRYFAFGILAFHIFDYLRTTRLAAKDMKFVQAAAIHTIFATLTAIFVIVQSLYYSQLKALWHLEMAVWGGLFTVLCVWLTVRPLRLLNWAPIQYLGERSYSLYLIHFPVLLLLKPFTAFVYYTLQPYVGPWAVGVAVMATYLPTIALSAITYRLIESPGMNLGKRLNSYLDRSSSGRSADAVARN